MSVIYSLLLSFVYIVSSISLLGMDAKSEESCKIAQQVVSRLSLLYYSEKYPFVKEDSDPEQLHIASTAPIGVSYDDCSKAKVDEYNNIPDPQFWVKPTDKPIGGYQIRYAYDQPPEDFIPKKTVITFPLSCPSKDTSQLFFDGPNKQKKLAHAQVDVINKKTTIYCMPAENERDYNVGGWAEQKTQHSYSGEEVKKFKITDVKGCITALTLLSDVNKIVYCTVDKIDLPQRHMFNVISVNGKGYERKAEFLISVCLKKVLCIRDNDYLGLSQDGQLCHILGLQSKCILQQTALKFADIAIDPETKDLAFLDTKGGIYVAQADNVHDLKHIYTLDKIEKDFVERISYKNKEVFVIYGTTKDDKLINGVTTNLKK